MQSYITVAAKKYSVDHIYPTPAPIHNRQATSTKVACQDLDLLTEDDTVLVIFYFFNKLIFQPQRCNTHIHSLKYPFDCRDQQDCLI